VVNDNMICNEDPIPLSCDQLYELGKYCNLLSNKIFKHCIYHTSWFSQSCWSYIEYFESKRKTHVKRK